MRISRRILAGLATASLAVTATSCGGGSSTSGSFDDTVTVGILHSLSGTMAISESTLVDTEKMAIEEINAAGGVTVGGKSYKICLLYTSPSPRDLSTSRMPSSA